MILGVLDSFVVVFTTRRFKLLLHDLSPDLKSPMFFPVMGDQNLSAKGAHRLWFAVSWFLRTKLRDRYY